VQPPFCLSVNYIVHGSLIRGNWTIVGKFLERKPEMGLCCVVTFQLAWTYMPCWKILQKGTKSIM
nr:hypothetical protein [Tanacetum cinerariifolium]